MSFHRFIRGAFDLRNFAITKGQIIFIGIIISIYLFYLLVCWDIALTQCVMTNGFSEACWIPIGMRWLP